MDIKILIKDEKGNTIHADVVAVFTCAENNKEYVALNNGDLVFSKDSSYNNLDILEVIKEENNTFFVSNIPDNEWDAVKDTLINEIFAKIKE